MTIFESERLLEWGELDVPLFGLAKDWHGARVEPAAGFALVSDAQRLWFVANHRRPAQVHPQARPGRFQPELWRYDVAELFVADPGSGRYFEFNLAPNGAWWTCEFTAPRVRAEAVEIAMPEVAAFSELAADGSWVAALAVPLDLLRARLDFGPATRANVTFILETPGNGSSAPRIWAAPSRISTGPTSFPAHPGPVAAALNFAHPMDRGLAGGHSGVCSAVLSHRFQIQDLVAQDLSGVTFRALDIESGEAVAVRRFFPFGVDGGGLFDEERTGYDVAVARLAGLKHPGLRAVLTGGCDPVDGMPFVVTEWITGEALADRLEHGVFSPAAAIRVLDRALELSEALSRVLAEEAVWVETHPALIIEDRGDSHRGLTFAISPMKWLGGETTRRSLLPVADLADDLLGWRGMMVADQAGNGLGSWVKWLRAHAETLTLFEARQSLASFTGGAAPEPAQTIVPVAPEPMPVAPHLMPAVARPVRVDKPVLKQPLVWTIGLLAVAVAVAGWWMLKLPSEKLAIRPDPQAAAERPAAARVPEGAAPAKPADEAAQRVAESQRLAEINALAASLVKGEPPPSPQAPAVAEGTQPSRVFQSGETQPIINEKGREVTVEGVLKNLRASDTGKTLYLEFAETTAKEEVRGYILSKNAAEDMSEQALKELLGKRIRITGVVRTMRYFKAEWPEVLLVDRKSIQEVK